MRAKNFIIQTKNINKFHTDLKTTMGIIKTLLN